MRVLVHFFFLQLIFTLVVKMPLAFLIFPPLLQNFHVVLPTKTISPLSFISRTFSG